MKVGERIFVCYKREIFPGEIISTSSKNQDVEVKVMNKSGSGWKWPKREDKKIYKVEDIEMKIKPLTSAGTVFIIKSHYFCQTDCYVLITFRHVHPSQIICMSVTIDIL